MVNNIVKITTRDDMLKVFKLFDEDGVGSIST